MSLIDNVGMPINESLPRVIDKISEAGLRDRIKVISSGKLINPAEVAWALCVGADFVTSARGFMFSLGCIQALQCHKNTCPTGITTHNRKLQLGRRHAHIVQENGTSTLLADIYPDTTPLV
jgi:glutamate synthase domain-containing protein 2